jgi:transcriptional regulator with XRE-family HTH domain
MGRKLQQLNHAIYIGQLIDGERQRRGLTLDALETSTGVHKGQLSRFCAGRFKTISQNLQKVLNKLQITDAILVAEKEKMPAEILERLERSWARAGPRREALISAISAIERLLD